MTTAPLAELTEAEPPDIANARPTAPLAELTVADDPDKAIN
jgi:hypothetical protein